jgi:hypothetical protein
LRVSLAERVIRTLSAAGDLVLAHWIGETNYPLSGDAASERLLQKTHAALGVVLQRRFERFRLDVARRV